jgi:hypothetical protein
MQWGNYNEGFLTSDERDIISPIPIPTSPFHPVVLNVFPDKLVVDAEIGTRYEKRNI